MGRSTISIDKMAPRSDYFCILFLLCCVGVDVLFGDSLYSSGDGIVQLNVHNFDQTLSNTENAWIVEFYATWCGHCQKFAPIWKQFAEDIADWSGLIRVAAVACSDPSNLPVCRRQHIYGFPTVKLYPGNMRTVTRGQKLTSLRFDVNNIRTATVRFLEGYLLNPRDTEIPNLTPHRNVQTLNTLARDVSADHIIAVVEDDRQASETAELAKSVILDMSEFYPEVIVARITRSSFPEHQADIWRPLPALVAFNIHDNYSARLISSLTSREDAVRRIKHYISLHQPMTSPTATTWHTTTPQPTTVTATTTSYWATSGALKAVAVSSNSPNLPVALTQEDMDSNIYYTLWNEVAARAKIRGRALSALKGYIGQLAKHHPGNERLRSYLEAVQGWLQRIGGSLDGHLYLNTIEGLQTNESYVKQELTWNSCQGSQNRFRGYPCSLWMTFHAMTVGAYENYLQRPHEPFDPMTTLGAIRQYVRYFLGCRDCAQHFLRMARHMEAEVTRPEDVVLWLWRGHNRANNRLHADETEDPHHPKIQFPGPAACPQCRHGDGPFDKFNNETTWDYNEVLAFLRKFYTITSSSNSTGLFSAAAAGSDDVATRAPDSHHHGGNSPHNPPDDSTPQHEDPQPLSGDSPGGSRDLTSCPVQDLPWSSCSVTCGTGVSMRMNNNNSACLMEMDMRLCQERPCDYRFDNGHRAGFSRTCSRYSSIYHDSILRRLTFNNCTTTLGYRWRYCGPCPRFCCQSIGYGTVNSDVTCFQGNSRQTGSAKIALIQSCACTEC